MVALVIPAFSKVKEEEGESPDAEINLGQEQGCRKGPNRGLQPLHRKMIRAHRVTEQYVVGTLLC